MNPQLVSPTGSSVAGHYLLAAITTYMPYDTPGWNAVMQALKDYRATAPSGIERGKVPVSLIVAGHEIPFIETVGPAHRPEHFPAITRWEVSVNGRLQAEMTSKAEAAKDRRWWIDHLIGDSVDRADCLKSRGFKVTFAPRLH